MTGRNDVEDLLAMIDELIKLAEKAGGRNGGKDRQVVLCEVRKQLRAFDQSQSDSHLLQAMELLSGFLMGER